MARSIQYSENKKDLKYESVTLKNDGVEYTFKSGNFVKDWFDCTHKIVELQPEFVCDSSSVDHFLMDSGLYESRYLVSSNGTDFELVKHTDSKYKEDSIEIFVDKGTNPTWEELKKIVGFKTK